MQDKNIKKNKNYLKNNKIYILIKFHKIKIIKHKDDSLKQFQFVF